MQISVLTNAETQALEYVTMRTARLAGLSVADVELKEFRWDADFRYATIRQGYLSEWQCCAGPPGRHVPGIRGFSPIKV